MADALGQQETPQGFAAEKAATLQRMRETSLSNLPLYSGWPLEFASTAMRADKEVVLEAVKLDGSSLQYASEELRADRDVVIQAVRKYGHAMTHANRELRSDKEVIMEAMKQNVWALRYASEELRADKEVITRAVQQEGCMLQFASENLRADKDIVMMAVKLEGSALGYSSFELREDRELVLEAVKQCGRALWYAPLELQADKDLLLLAARSSRDLDRLSLISGAKASLKRPHFDFEKCVESALAARGEDAPIVTVSLSQSRGQVNCSATLMSGTSFDCRIPDCKDDLDLARIFNPTLVHVQRPYPVLEDLARVIVAELPKHSEALRGASRPKHIFIHLVTGSGDGDGDSIAATAWDWERPLSDFLPSSTQGSSPSDCLVATATT